MSRELPTPLLMAIAAREAENRIFAAVQAAGYTDLTLAQSRIVAGVDPQGTRLSVLAERAQIARQTATALVDRLQAAGYVERVPDPSDGRARLARLAERALACLPAAQAEERRIEQEWRAHLGSDRMSALREALTMLRSITDPWAPAD